MQITAQKSEAERLAMLKAEDDKKHAAAEAKRKAEEEAARRVPRPGETFRDCPECPEMVVLPAGEFIMGSNEFDNERPPHKVTIGQPFAVGKYEVTFAEWEACVADVGCANRTPDDEGWGKGRRPVINVSWNDAKHYVAWLSRKTGKTYRLLTEAEWEYSARAGTATKYAFGDTITNRHARLSASGTVEVGSFQPNKFGLHDMHGNVLEWCEDNWHTDYRDAPNDGSAWYSGRTSLQRVLRGGSWYDKYPAFLRSSSRTTHPSPNRDYTVGFRVASTLLWGNYVSVISSHRTRIDALNKFADLQKKYEILRDKMPDVLEADLSAHGLGTMYRLVVGPPGSREVASTFCGQIKSAGHPDCWITGY
jgi:formylglycine-generating enzyme required for sulfatase activity